jgi:hypothetical protein
MDKFTNSKPHYFESPLVFLLRAAFPFVDVARVGDTAETGALAPPAFAVALLFVSRL